MPSARYQRISAGRYRRAADTTDADPIQPEAPADVAQDQPGPEAAANRPVEQGALQEGRLGRCDGNRGVELFPDARRRKEHARHHLAQILADAVGALDVVADRARMERLVNSEHAFHEMGHRQEGEALVAGVLAE